MHKKEDGSEMAAQLRWRAEEKWRAEEIAQSKGVPPPRSDRSLSLEESRKTIHELRVHQIELKMQNEELRRVQADLDASRAHYFDLYDLAPVGYCILSMEGLILEANLTVVSLLGEARSTLLKQPLTRFILKEDQDIYYLHRKQLFESNAPHSCELRLAKKDGTILWVSLSATPPNASGEADAPPQSRLVLSDITDRKRVEIENARLLEQLRQARSPQPGRIRPEQDERGSKRT
jgi:PAS domain S-box-containing protein